MSTTAKRGRPLGSPSLTDAVIDTIVAYVEAGSFAYVAAEAAGVSDRTFRDWIARGEGRSPRRSTERHRRFADRVRQAEAKARISAEVRTHRDNPNFWLSRAARSRPGREGWTEPSERMLEQAARLGLTEQDLQREVDRMLALLAEEGAFAAPPCDRVRCRCSHHRSWRERYPRGGTP
jgi:3-hydroxyisobutyrate dehydrogenase-like beta-hydroxyacid dehydrogenase